MVNDMQTKEMICNYFTDEKRFLYYNHGADEIPDEIIAEFSAKDVTKIDFTSNSLVSLDCIAHFVNLREVILDNNYLSDAMPFPKKDFPNITLLSLNNNKFEDLNQLVENLARCFPNARYLSLLGNPLCPALRCQKSTDQDYISYRLLVISRMSKLRFLDEKRVDKGERTPSLQRPPDRQTTSERPEERMQSVKNLVGMSPKPSTSAARPSTSTADAYTPLPTDNPNGSPSSQKSVYGKVKSHYEGSQSQGNRFILNQDL